MSIWGFLNVRQLLVTVLSVSSGGTNLGRHYAGSHLNLSKAGVLADHIVLNLGTSMPMPISYHSLLFCVILCWTLHTRVP